MNALCFYVKNRFKHLAEHISAYDLICLYHLCLFIKTPVFAVVSFQLVLYLLFGFCQLTGNS